MPLDPNISLYANAPPGGQQGFANPDSINKLIGTATSIKDFQAKQAIGEAYKQATDAQTGDTDYNKLTGLITQNPQAAWGAPDAITKARAQVNQYLVGKNLSADAWRNQIDILGRALDPLLADADVMSGKKGVDPGAAIDAAARVANLPNSPFSNADILKFVQGMPKDPMQVRQRLLQLHGERLSADQAHAALYGTPTLVDQGQQIAPITQSTVTGTRPNGPPLPLSMSPATAATPVPGPPGPKGTPTNQPLGNFGAQFGIPGAVPGRGAAPQAAPGGPFANGGRYQPPAAPPIPVGGTMPTARAPGEDEADRVVGTKAGEQFGNDKFAAGNFADRVYPLNQAIEKLQDLGKTGTGPGTAEVNNIKSFLQSVPGVGDLIGIDPKKIESFDDAHKYLMDYARRRASSFGPNTNENLSTALSSNASTSISNLAATNIAKASLALERMKQAQTLSAIDEKVKADEYPAWAAKRNTNSDVRAFAIDQVPDPAKVIASLKTPAEKANFAASLRQAIKYGLVTPPSALGAAPNAP